MSRFPLAAALSAALSILTLTACQDPTALASPGTPEQVPVGDTAVGTPLPPPPKAAQFDLLFDRWESDESRIVRPLLVRTAAFVDSTVIDDSVQAVTGIPGAFDASVSAAHNVMVYTCTTGHGTTLCRSAIDGTGARTMLPNFSALNADQPALSPDGQRVAFRGWAPGGTVGLFNPAHIYIVDIDGTNLTRIAAGAVGAASLASPTWSPEQTDGSYRLAYARQARSAEGYVVSHLEVMRDDGSESKALTAASEHLDTEPTWSPDGRLVAFIRRSASAAGDLWVVPVNDSFSTTALPVAHPLMSTDPDGEQRAPAWSPDGKRLAFVSAHEILGTFYNWQVYSVAVDGTQLVRHTSSPHEHANPVWVNASRSFRTPLR
ncbi:MAG: PD40 domain-containing protein [Gemmatimonadaceae bacterium]|nr:PD40 domain-containing protein [Gemmatimonadaceae bacterium]